MGTASSSLPEAPPPLHLITDDATLSRDGFTELAEGMLRRGGPEVALHLRAWDFPARSLLRMAERLVPAAREGGGWLLLNDRVDLALASGARGVQVGARGMPVGEARRLLGPEATVGASVHSLEEATRPVREGADFLVAGTLFPSASHPGRPGSGTTWLTALRPLGVPVVGIGGITPERVAEVVRAGAAGVAVLGGVWSAQAPAERMNEYLRALRETSRVTESIRVQVNGEPREIPGGLSVQGLLEHLSLQPRMVVVERNGDILRRDSYPAVPVAAGDELELVHFVGGG